jgi:hypothetical protein
MGLLSPWQEIALAFFGHHIPAPLRRDNGWLLRSRRSLANSLDLNFKSA